MNTIPLSSRVGGNGTQSQAFASDAYSVLDVRHFVPKTSAHQGTEQAFHVRTVVWPHEEPVSTSTHTVTPSLNLC